MFRGQSSPPVTLGDGPGYPQEMKGEAGTTMKFIRIALATVIAGLGGIGAAHIATASGSPADDNPNHPAYWEKRTEHPATCYAYNPPGTSNAHGKLVDDGKAVELYAFDQDWPGDHWELLVVKSGSRDIGYGDGNAVYPHPVAGTAYYGPTNSGGQQGAVSHWIVCKGTSPTPATTQVSWSATDGDCANQAGTLALAYDPKAVTYTGDAAGPYGPGDSVSGSFVAKTGFVISGAAGPFSHTFGVTGAPCPDPVVFDKAWDGGTAPDLDGAVLLTASSSLGSATCTSDDGTLSCSYTRDGEPAEALFVPAGETYSVTEAVPAGWYTVSGAGSGFSVADDAESATHLVTNAPTTSAPEPTFVDPTCASRGASIVDPDLEDGISYEVVAGSATPGVEVTVRAVAGDGIVLEGTTEWSHTFGSVTDDDCVLAGTPSSSLEAECGAATLTFVNTAGPAKPGYTGETIRFAYTVDGVEQSIDVAPGDTETVELSFDEDSGDHTVAIGDDEPTVVGSNCEPDVAQGGPTTTTSTTTAPTTTAPKPEGTLPAPTVPGTKSASGGPTTVAGELPRTGGDGSGRLLGVGMILLVAGAAMVGLVRRPRTA